MPFTPEQIEQVAQAMEEWLDREDQLFLDLMAFGYRNTTAEEFMKHGLGRRLRMIRHCVERVFESVPMNEAEPTDEDRLDATAFLHAFVINVFGAIDNMAHIWCNEAGLRDERGRHLPRSWVGLTPQNLFVRGSLSEPFRAYLTGIDEWFGYLEDYRHALAHRIPLYIPPRFLDPAAQAEHARIQELMNQAFPNDRDLYFALFDEQRRLGTFDPWMMHSFGETARPIRFHAQIVCDFATVVEIGEYLMREIHSLQAH